MSNANAEFDKQKTETDDIPQGGDTIDNSYVSRGGQSHIPVVKDEMPVEQPNDRMNPDSDEMLGASPVPILTAPSLAAQPHNSQSL